MSHWAVRTVFTGVQGTPWLSTMRFGTSGSAADAVAAVGAFWTAMESEMHTDVNWDTLQDVEQFDPGGVLLTIDSVTPETGSGEDVSDPLPFANQGLLRWRTGAIIAGRELRGRTFLPAPTEGSGAGTPSSTYLSNANAAGAALINDINSALIIWSPTHQEEREVVSSSVWTDWAIQRSRRD